MSMNSLKEARKLLKGSERESSFDWRAVGLLVVGGLLVLFFGRGLAFGSSVGFGPRAMPTATAELDPWPTQAVIVPPADPVVEAATATMTPAAAAEPMIVVVTATPTVTPWPTPAPVIEYIEVPVEVEVIRVVTETVPAAWPTPIPLAAGVVEVCVRVEGAREIYIGQSGVVSGACERFSFGVGTTFVEVQINK